MKQYATMTILETRVGQSDRQTERRCNRRCTTSLRQNAYYLRRFRVHILLYAKMSYVVWFITNRDMFHASVSLHVQLRDVW